MFKAGTSLKGKSYDEVITVPYCVESYLSGINKTISSDDYLIYRRFVTFPKKFIKDNYKFIIITNNSQY